MVKPGRKTQVRAGSRKRNTSIAIAAVAVLLVIVVAAAVLLRPPPPPELAADSATDPVLGAADAPLTMFYFADFRCGHCRAFENGAAFAQLDADYIGTDRVRLVFKNYPVLGDASWVAAQASVHVWTEAPQDYWSWHHAFFEQQDHGVAWYTPQNIAAFAAQHADVDEDAMLAAITGEVHRGKVEEDRRVGEGNGVQGTPTAIINGRLVNPGDYPALRAIIEEELAREESRP